ncbi:MAG: histidine kinase [Synechococcaceae bacterium WB8_1B_136]|nr:histidine kinase [Synechococcaceae bacterium WB8_1B_136]
MTTADQTSSPAANQGRAWLGYRPPRGWSQRQRLLSAAGLAAALLGSQSLAASSPQASDVRLLLPSEGLLAGLGDGLRRGYGLAMEQSRICGRRPPSLQLGWLPPGADPGPALAAMPRSALLVAPPAAPLAAYGQLADRQRLTVLLPLQRGTSLERLPQQPGADRLWPLVPGRSLEADRLARGLLEAGSSRVMAVHDGSTEEQSLTARFGSSFGNGGGQLLGPTQEPMPVDAGSTAALEQLDADVAWYRPQALVVFTRPGSPLARAVQQRPWPGELMLAWPFPVETRLAQAQLGVDPLSRGAGWPAFARSFRQRWGYQPGVVEGAGYDAGLVAALASVRSSGRSGWDLNWFNAKANPLPLCTALQRRAQGAAVRPRGVSSELDLSPGLPPTADLQLSRATALSELQR